MRLEARALPRHPGGQSVADGMMALHYYDRDLNGQFRLALVPLGWDADGWPELHW